MYDRHSELLAHLQVLLRLLCHDGVLLANDLWIHVHGTDRHDDGKEFPARASAFIDLLLELLDNTAPG